MEHFKATAVVKIVVDVTVKGDTFEKALKNAKGLNNLDVVDIHGDYIDSKPIEIVNVWKDKDWLD